MADSIAPVEIGPDWTDLYAASGFDVGTPLLVVPIGPGGDVRVAISATKPTGAISTRIPYGQEATIDGEQSGAWASSSGGPATVYVQRNSDGAVRLTPFSDSRIVEGNKAVTVQAFTELNIKNGVQYYIRTAWPLGATIPSGGTRNVYFTIGAKTVLTKLRIFDYIGEELTIAIYSAPDVSDGTPITVNNWNLKNPVATTVTATKDVTVNDLGTLASDPEYFFGGGSTGQRVASSIPEGFERVVPPNSTFLIQITNTSNSVARAQYFLTWYEGEISTEIP